MELHAGNSSQSYMYVVIHGRSVDKLFIGWLVELPIILDSFLLAQSISQMPITSMKL